MKKNIILLLLIFTFGNSTYAQNKFTETKKLVTLGKMYGFLKYYHPEVGAGKYDWDKELIKYIPEVLKATDKKSLSEIYSNWIDNLGNIKKCKKCNSEKPTFDKNFNLSWTQDPIIFTNELAEKLRHIENNRIQGENFYVTTEQVGKIKVLNEPIYEDFEYPNEEYRLLGLFKYWNIIEYFYPYKYLTDQNWNSVLLEMIPKFRTASNKNEYQANIKELVAKLDDTHAWIDFYDEKPKYLPVKISNIENNAVVSGFYNDSLANLNNLKLGDKILKINGVDIKKETEIRSKYISGSNTNIKIKKTYSSILIGKDSIVTLEIERENQIKKIEVNRYNFKDFNYWYNPKSIKWKSINNSIGYINMVSIKGADVSDIFKSFENKESIILDLRNSTRHNFYQISSQINSEKRDFLKIYEPNINYPGKFVYKKNLKTGFKNKNAFQGKIIILVNDGTYSISEMAGMALQTGDNVITIGSQTAGADGDVVTFKYLGGYKTTFSGIGLLYPDGSETQRKGIKIDIKIKPTINGLRQGRDEVLERAIELASE